MKRLRPSWLVACGGLLLAIYLPPVSASRKVLDCIIVVDITQSMNTLDGVLDGEPVSRLSLTKSALVRALPRLPCGSKLGLGIFTEYRTLLLFAPVEICSARQELENAILNLNGQMAWAGDSQIAKGLYSGLKIAHDLPEGPSIVFVTDGQEAPPINASHRIEYGGEPGAVAGTVVGIGGAIPAPIPKFDPDGRPVGFWTAAEVLQNDLYTTGRQGNVEHEPMAESEPAKPVPLALRGSPGTEHLSYLHEEYLKLLAAETHLAYTRLDTANRMREVLTAPSLLQRRNAATDCSWIAGTAALLAMLLSFARRGF